MDQTIIVVCGPPCSGKSTVGDEIARRAGFTHVITSDLLRRYRASVKAVMDAGGVIGDDVMIPVLDDFVPRAGGLVIDTLRSQKQVMWLKKVFPKAKILSLHFDVSEEEIQRRLEASSRTERGARSDDQAILRRLKEYRQYWPDTKSFLNCMTLYESVDANKSLKEVFEMVLEICVSWGVYMAPMLSEAEAEVEA